MSKLSVTMKLIYKNSSGRFQLYKRTKINWGVFCNSAKGSKQTGVPIAALRKAQNKLADQLQLCNKPKMSWGANCKLAKARIPTGGRISGK
jgi:hypothetical protein